MTDAEGRRGELPVAGLLTIRIGFREMSGDCIIASEQADPLVEQVVMKTLDLIADSLNQTLGPKPESPDRPLMRV